MEFFTQFDSNASFSNERVSQQLAIKELLDIRFKVMDIYPYSEFKVGDVIAPKSNLKIEHYKAFPRIFRELKWYEDLVSSKMPDYVKSKNDGMVLKVVDKILKDSIQRKKIVTLEDHTGSQCDMFVENYAPAIEYEYSLYVKKKSGK